MPQPNHATIPTRTTLTTQDRPIDELVECLGMMVHEHERLLALARAQRELISRGEHSGIAGNIEAQNVCVQRIAQLESSRRTVVGRIAPTLIPAKQGSSNKNDAGPTVLQLAQTLEPTDSQRLQDAAQRLRKVIGMIQSENAAIRVAADTIAKHFQGLGRQVAEALSHTGTYARSGRVGPSAPALASGLDLTS